jgi:hypothetical protein
MRTPWITARLAESDKLIGVGIASAQPTFLALIAWRVERMHNWMQRCQCLLIRWDKQMRNYLGVCMWLVPTLCCQSGLLG